MYIRKLKDKWRVEIQRDGVRQSAVFLTKTEATAWGIREEAALMAAKRGVFPKRTFAEALARYAQDVSSTKAGARWEQLRIEALVRDFPALCGKVIHKLTTQDMVAWRDARLKTVSKGTVQRELNLISHVFTKARDEWRWMGDSPFAGMQSPGDNPARDQLPTSSEIRRILRWLGHFSGRLPTSKQAEVAFAYLLSLRTGMRAGEVLQLGPATVSGSVATVHHKMEYRTGKPRKIPISRRTQVLLAGFKGFTIGSASLDSIFRKARDSLCIKDVHFHDARAHALTRMSKRVDAFELARISGHKDLRILMSTYYRASSEDIASRL